MMIGIEVILHWKDLPGLDAIPLEKDIMEEIQKNLIKYFDFFVKEITEIGEFFSQFEVALDIYTMILHWLLPVMSIVICLRCFLPLLTGEKQNRVWGNLGLHDGSIIPLTHWENSIGRNKLCDIVIDLAFVSRNHAVMTFDGGSWSVTDLESKGGIEINGKEVLNRGNLCEGDIISVAGYEMTLLPPDNMKPGIAEISEIDKIAQYAGRLKPGLTLSLILLFQMLGSIQIWFSNNGKLNPAIQLTFFLFIITEVILYFCMRWNKKYFELELLCYYLCGLGLFNVASAAPNSLYKQLVSIVTGIAVYIMLNVLLRSFKSARRLKYVLTIFAMLLMLSTLAIGETRFGAKNWINLGFITFQPFEFIKVAFVIAGAATLDKLLTTRNLTAYILFSGACIGSLVLMRDLGTAVIFFVTFLVIAFMRSGDLRIIGIISGLAIMGAIVVVAFMPHIAERFKAWGRVWEFVNSSGYQQTRTMIATASGGLLGMGGGNGYLVNIAAADTDLVFGVLCEEWGLIIAFIAVLIIAFFALFAVLLTKNCRSSLYAISACGVASVFLIQTALNVFGSVDILPLTGVTMPFVSNGGSSMIASWGLMAFIKSADARLRPAKLKKSVGNGEKI